MRPGRPRWIRLAWAAAIAIAVASRLWNALHEGVLLGYDAWGHLAYVLFIDLYRAIPLADQGWSYFHPPLHYLMGWVIAQAGDARVLVRGLSILGSAMSLGLAGVAASLVRQGIPERPGLAPLAFLAIAFLPVHVYTSPMPGNEITASFLGALAIAHFLRNESRPRPGLASDAGTGALAGLSLLSKFSGLIPLAVIGASLAWCGWRRGGAAAAPRLALRGAVLCGVALLVCGPYYARNVAEFGTPFQLSRGYPLVAEIESQQPPGERAWSDFLSFPPELFARPFPEQEPLLRSVWGTAYVGMWSDARLNLRGDRRRIATPLLWLGLAPTALALAGFFPTLGRALRRRDAPLETTLVLLALATLAAFAGIAWRVPTHAALKASYMLGLSLPYGFFLARSLAWLAGRWRPAAGAAALAVLAACAAAAVLFTPGVVLDRRIQNARMAAVHAHFGETGRAREILTRSIRISMSAEQKVFLREAIASLMLQAGDAEAARLLFSRSADFRGGGDHQLEDRASPWLANRRALALALSGDRDAALATLDGLIAAEPLPEILASRAALRLDAGDLDGAEADLRLALDLDPRLPPAWTTLAEVLERRQLAEQARSARERGRTLALAPPRGFPYGVGDGFHVAAERFMLVFSDGKPALYHPARSRWADSGSQ